ncbi:hypothetical protein BGZ96_000545 [Linnemannia gamsii]|uniref:Outer spore wall protein 5 n=1 Tax=Linnemannia gamsii TaxID=64522 RepID=A0ABQ7JP02_9FUNG|nr:hypothetical protein BGZ96_000545 [Linnemannia gamsii]
MSDRGPFALARSRAGSESYMDSSGRNGHTGSTDWSDPSDDNSSKSTNGYNVRYLFNILLITFSSIPTTIFLAWIFTWAIVILYLCTFGFAMGVACVTGLSMVIYGPILCCCVISAFGCSLVYNVSRYACETAWMAWDTVRRVLFNILVRPFFTSDKNITKRGDRARTVPAEWSPLSWLFGGTGDTWEDEDGGSAGWGTLGAPPKEPDWGTQPLEEKFETRPATTLGASPLGLGGGGMGMGKSRFQPPIPGSGTAGSLTSGGGGIAGHGGRKGHVRPGDEDVPPYHVR